MKTITSPKPVPQVSSKNVPGYWPLEYWRAATILRALSYRGRVPSKELFRDTKAVNLLREAGYIDFGDSDGFPKACLNDDLIWELTPAGKAKVAQDLAERQDAKALVPVVPRPRKRPMRKGSSSAKYPSQEWVADALDRALVSGTGVSFNDDGEFSSPLLTQAYVTKFLELNGYAKQNV